MGLTIHYRLALRPEVPDLDDLRARWVVEEARKLAVKMKRRGAFEAVGPLRWDSQAHSRAVSWLSLPSRDDDDVWHGVEVPPLRGHVFRISAGRDCEPLCVGLCQYPTSVWARGREWRVRRRAAWCLEGSSKTQYASLHGWEHFRRCHVAIVDFLAALRPLGFEVKISDEGGYWPRRRERTLRANIDQMNRLVAAAAGQLKDAHENDGGVQAAIFAHPHFERLEAEGADLLGKQT